MRSSLATANFRRVTLTLMFAAASLWSADRYSVTDLGPMSNLSGRDDAGPRQINGEGQIAAANVTGGAYRAFLYGGAWTNLGTLGGDESLASGINLSGRVVGRSRIDSTVTHAYLWTPGGTDGVPGNPPMKDLGLLPGGTNSEATGINSFGQITGYSDNGTSDHAVLYSSGTMADIGVLLGNNLPYSYGLAINDAGHIVGLAYNRSFSSPSAFFYNGTTAVEFGRSGDKGTSALAINAGDQVAGYLTTSNGFDHAFRYAGGVVTDLGTLGGGYAYGIAINNRNVIVGGSFVDADNLVYHAFIATNSQLVDLNTLLDATGAGWTLTEARAINDENVITGMGTYAGESHAFLLIPAASGPPPPVINGVRLRGPDVLVSFTTITGATYTLVGRAEVASGAWTDLVGGIPGTGGTVTATNFGALTDPQRFYRARLNQP